MNKPNVLFVFADQLRYTGLACNGNSVVRTPALDRLASEGVVFDHAFSSCPICSPYRGQLLTGRYSHANGVVCNEYVLSENQQTLPEALKAEGYRTTFIGKWHLGHGPYPEPKRHGFDDLYAYNCAHDYYRVFYHHNEAGPYSMTGFAPRIETELAIDYIRDHSENCPDVPFALCVSWGPPHWTHASARAPRNYGVYPPEYEIYDPAEVDVPDNVPVQFRDFAAREIADYYAMTTALDDCLAKILDALESLGIADETIVCFSSDHGDHLSAHGYGKPGDEWMSHSLRGSKATPHDESVHVPFLLRYPDQVAAGQRTNAMLNSVDVMPTLLGLCDIATPSSVQGTDLSHAVLGADGPEPDSVYLQILGPGWPTRTKWLGLWRGVRTHHFTYARWADRGGMRVLYDLEKDPLEMTNVVDDPAYEEVATAMEQRLQQWTLETDDPLDAGPRLPVTDMLDLGQRFSHPNYLEVAPREYVEALVRG